MCVTNIAARTYYEGGMPVATTNFDKMTHTAREMTEAQRDSWEALTENLAAAQRRSVGLAQDGMEFLRLQEQNAKAAEQWLASSMRVAQLQQRNARFAQNWLREGAEALREQTEHNLRTAEAFARSARKQQEGFRALVQGWTDVYEGFFFSPFKYAQESTEQGLKATQRVVEQGAETTQQVARQGLRVAEEATEQTEEVLRQTEQATREAELRVSVLSALETADYEGMTVAEITEKLDDLSADELKKLREFEKRNKDRESLVERIDRKIKANS
jgi:hypothetical protein